jgi:hypothetical protein
MAELHRIFGNDVSVETFGSSDPQAIVERARSQRAAAIVFDHASPATREEVANLAPELPLLRSRRRTEEKERELGRNERGQRVKGTQTTERFDGYDLDDREKLTPIPDKAYAVEREMPDITDWNTREQQRDEQERYNEDNGYEY